MKKKELRRMSRSDLLEILVEQGERIEELEKELDEANRKVESREIKIRESGSIAEAAMKLNGVFEAAEAAAKQYVENVKSQSPELPGEDERKTEEKEKERKKADTVPADRWNAEEAVNQIMKKISAK